MSQVRDSVVYCLREDVLSQDEEERMVMKVEVARERARQGRLERAPMSYEEEDTCMSYAEEDTCMSCIVRRGRLERAPHSLRAEGWREMSGIVRNDDTCASVI